MPDAFAHGLAVAGRTALLGLDVPVPLEKEAKLFLGLKFLS